MQIDRKTLVASALRTLALLAGVLVVVFVLVRLMPGDAVDTLAAEGDFDEGAQAALRSQFGLDQSWPAQFATWTARAAHGDLGLSLRYERPVSDLILNALPSTLDLAARSLLIGVVLGVGLSLLAVLRPKPFATVVQVLNVWSIALPTFCVGLAFILVFAIWLRWMPVLHNTALAALVIGIDIAGQIAKPLTEELRETLSAPFVRAARARGHSPARIAWRHLLPNALPVVVALTGLILAGLIGGTLTMEALFGLPGLGTVALQAISGRDYPVVQAVILFFAVAVVAMNFLTDLVQAVLDPRLRRMRKPAP